MAHLAPLSVCHRECPLQPVSCSQATLYQTCKVALSLQACCMQTLKSSSAGPLQQMQTTSVPSQCRPGRMQFTARGEITNLLGLPTDVTEKLLLRALIQARCRGTEGRQCECIIIA